MALLLQWLTVLLITVQLPYAWTAICGNARVELPEQCDPPGPCCSTTCQFITTVCRAAAGQCDAPETCANGVCPDDRFKADGAACVVNNSPGQCKTGRCIIAGTGVCGNGLLDQPTEQCDPPSPCCTPECKFRLDFECRPAAGVCDVAEKCNGGVCPTDLFQRDGTACTVTGGAAGTCQAGRCILSSQTSSCGDGRVDTATGEQCEPPNTVCCSSTCKYMDGAPCLDPTTNLGGMCSAGQCLNSYCGDGTVDTSIGEQCEPPSTPCCTSNCEFQNDNQMCADATEGSCLAASTCMYGTCQSGAYQPDGTACLDANSNSGSCSNGQCVTGGCGDSIIDSNVGEECDPPDGLCCSSECKKIEGVCRPANGVCDIEEVCTDGQCPGDNLVEINTPCTDPVTNVAGYCDAGQCIPTTGGYCGDSLVDLSTGEQCDPPDEICCSSSCQIIDGGVCRASRGPCDIEELCNNGVCPGDNLVENDTPCTDSETGLAGVCAAGECKTVSTCGDGTVDSTIGEQCDPPGPCCSTTCQFLTTVCRTASGQCDVSESCSRGVCPVDGYKLNGTSCTVNNVAGKCQRGQCIVQTAACGNQRVEPGEQCDPPGPCCSATCQFLTAVCREAIGVCDVAESCGNGICPQDLPKRNGTACTVGTTPGTCQRGQCIIQTPAVCGNGQVETGEQCDPPGLCCSATCTFLTATTVCREATGACDLAESCANGVCPRDGYKADGTVCTVGTSPGTCRSGQCIVQTQPVCGNTRVETGEQCDPPGLCCSERCTFLTTVCRAAVGPCDKAESCMNGVCPEDGHKSDGTACTVGTLSGQCASGQCITQTPSVCGNGQVEGTEQCDPPGKCCSATCKFLTGVVCRAAVGPCDAPETCVNGQCPADGFKGDGTVCKSGTLSGQCSNGQCLVQTVAVCGDGTVEGAEQCDPPGICCSSTCKYNTAVCRAAAGPCDVAEKCYFGECPVDEFKADGIKCTVGTLSGTCSSGQCLVVSKPICGNGLVESGEKCDPPGVCCSARCKFTTTVCRAAAGPCDVAEKCARGVCPEDTFKKDGIKCKVGKLAGTCSSGQCILEAVPVCGNGMVESGEQCDPPSLCCSAKCKFTTAVCRPAASTCDVVERCKKGLCPVDKFKKDKTLCKVGKSSGVCRSGQCYPSVCGNGIVENGESCDPPGVCCSATCKFLKTVCRAAVGTCDVAEKCTGNSAKCPKDKHKTNGVQCKVDFPVVGHSYKCRSGQCV